MRAFSNGLAYNAAFTYSKTKAFSNCGDFSTTCIQDIYNTVSDYGQGELDVPMVFTTSATYALPFGRGKQFLNSGVASAIAGGWQLNTILAIRSGTVINPTNPSNGDTANAGGGAERISFSSNPDSGAPHKIGGWFNNSAFALPANGTYGTAGINSLRGPAYWSDDLSVFRDIPITEKYKFQFRVESFDVFNHPNLGNPGIGYNNTTNTFTSLITSTVSTQGPGSQRLLQLALKLLF